MLQAQSTAKKIADIVSNCAAQKIASCAKKPLELLPVPRRTLTKTAVFHLHRRRTNTLLIS